ncbi:MAG: hypothetical protein GX340_02395, partial [Clostridiales bacterium]|nr:hypothetical protein [Clostridiales bacterium]
MKIGIPRALSYFDYFPLWQTFFKGLGFEVVVSSTTNKEILNKGVSLCVDDACLPVKLFHGHVADLVGRVDAIFIPRLISISPGEFICPKFIGLPEMIKNSIKDLPPLLILNYDLHKHKKDHAKAFYELGRQLGLVKERIILAYREALRRQAALKMVLEAGHNPLAILHPRDRWDDIPNARGTIGILGHPYLLYDRYLSMDMIKRIYDFGYNVRVPANVPEKRIEDGLKGMPKKFFWTYGKRILGSGMDW